ncbi:MAG TPA: gephyrin-like molybdotransferase Glp [Rhizomicrobium sp.]|nr:gephyrin-like molybdotransferase Glp [Rhizomicrobium sp.]
MISVDEALQRILAAFSPLESERVPIGSAYDRVLAEKAFARLNQPPFSVSSMDGYAVRAADVAQPPVRLKVTGTAPAGHPFHGGVQAGEAVRIFTGAVVPDGADAIVIQEDTEPGQEVVTIKAGSREGRHIRGAGIDFRRGECLAPSGKRLNARDLALLAAGDLAEICVRRRPRLVIAATGDELSRPGEPRRPGGIVASSVYALSALIEKWGGEPRDLGILRDRVDSIASIAKHSENADLVVTLGGVSVGDHDLVQRALGPEGFVLDFWKIAMRPGKPLIFGRLGKTPLLGLPGNPVSSYVCALLFLKPAIAAMLGRSTEQPTIPARLATDLPANDTRQDYLRAQTFREGDELWAKPFPVQDSSMQKVLAECDGFVIRAPQAPAIKRGARVQLLAPE